MIIAASPASVYRIVYVVGGHPRLRSIRLGWIHGPFTTTSWFEHGKTGATSNRFQSPSISKLDILKQFYCRYWEERSCPKRSSTSTRICSDEHGSSSVRTPPKRTPSTPHCPNW